jgi:TonB family protein
LGLLWVLKLFIAIALLSSCVPTQAQRRRPRLQPKFDGRPFDISVEDLPANYLGHSFLQIYSALHVRGPLLKKGEYESTIDYKNRLAGLSSWPISASLNSDSVVAFSLNSVKQSYDADLTALDMTLKFDGTYSSGHRTVSWLHTEKPGGSYIGRNAFNRAVRVKLYRYDDYQLSVEEELISRIPSFVHAQNGYSSSIIIPPQEAQRIRPNVRALLICRLSKDPVSRYESHSPATINEPYDEYTFTYTLDVVPLAVWFYDMSSGRVFAKLEAPQPKVPTVRNLGCPPVIVSKPEPQYTEEARRNQVTGAVTLKVVFAESGEVIIVSVVSGLPDGLTERAIAAAKKIKFSPVEVNGKKLSCPGLLEYNFNLY